MYMYVLYAPCVSPRPQSYYDAARADVRYMYMYMYMYMYIERLYTL